MAEFWTLDEAHINFFNVGEVLSILNLCSPCEDEGVKATKIFHRILSFSLAPMKPPLAILALMVVVSGCVPLREVSQVEGPAHPELKALYDRCILSGFDLNREKIDTKLSYIKSPGGKRYTIDVQRHQFDIDEKRSYVSALLYPVAADGSKLQGWWNGVWSFHFVVESNGVTQIIDQKWKYYYFYYSPLIYGAPN